MKTLFVACLCLFTIIISPAVSADYERNKAVSVEKVLFGKVYSVRNITQQELIEDKNKLKESEIEEIKNIFKTIIEEGERYDLDDIESWFENEGSWKNKESRIRIANLSNYIQDKYQQTAHLRVISDDDCSCGD